MNRCIGIDLGVTGAAAVVDRNEALSVHDLPRLKDELGSRMDGRKLLDLLQALVPANDRAVVVVEDIRARVMGGRGTQMKTEGSMMRSRGIFEACCDILRVRVVWVQPQTWKRAYGLIGKEKDDSRLMAIGLMPELAHDLQRKKDHNRAEALLLARYGITRLA